MRKDINYPKGLADVLLNVEADLIFEKSIKKYLPDIQKQIKALEVLIPYWQKNNEEFNVDEAELILIRLRQFEMKAKYMK